mgnify:CR=1 FL=1
MNGKQLKNSILQWAIQGKLVPQDPNDEPASVLLDKIRQEKERLIKEKKIKRDKNASIIYRGEDNSYYEKILATGEVKCIDEEIPFEIPVGWEWCRLRDIILGTNAGKSPNCEKRPKKSEEWGVLTTTSIQENAFLSNENKVLPKHYVINPEHCVRYGDILITRAGPVNRTGIVCMVENNCDKLILSDKTVRIDYMHDYCNPKFLVLVLNSSAIHELVMSATVGMAASQVNVSQSSIQNTFIPFPPSKEQQRIVNKLEALLPQIEKYDNAQNKLDELNKTVKDIIKKSVLQEAIQGKLVPQLAEEGTAQELLEQIKAEKEKLVKEGKLKKSALNDSVIFLGDDNKYYEQIGENCNDITDEIPFDLPYNWCWCRFSNIVSMTIGKTPARGEQTYWINGKYNWVSISDMVDGGSISTTKEKVSDLAVKEIFSAPISEKGSLLMSFKLSIGKTSILDIDAYHNEAIITIRPVIDKEYAMRNYLFKVLPLIANLGESKDAIKGKTLNSKSLANLLIPLPHLQEQQRIIEQVNILSKQLR